MAQGLWQVPEPRVSIPETGNSSSPCQKYFCEISSGLWMACSPTLDSRLWRSCNKNGLTRDRSGRDRLSGRFAGAPLFCESLSIPQVTTNLIMVFAPDARIFPIYFLFNRPYTKPSRLSFQDFDSALCRLRRETDLVLGTFSPKNLKICRCTVSRTRKGKYDSVLP